MGDRKKTKHRGMNRDVTARKNAENALKRSERRFRQIVESSPMGIHMYRLEPDGRLVFTGANPAADQLLAVDNSQFIGKTIEQAFPPLRATEVPFRYKRAAEIGETWRTEQLAYEDDQIKGAFEVYAFQTSPGNMVAFFLDVTDRVRVQAALKESEKQYRHLVENISDTIFTLDENGVFTYISPAIESVTGLAPAEIVGRKLTELIAEEDLPMGLDAMFEKRASGDTTPLEYRIKLKSGEAIWVRTSSKPLRIGDRITGYQGILVDITGAKRAEEEKEMLQAQLRQAQKMEAIGQLAGGVAHDFNNGGVVVTSDVGKGTAFDIYLPQANKPTEPVREYSVESTRESGNETIIVVEDDEMVRKLTSVILREYGYEVFCAGNAGECIELAEKKGKVDLLLTDIVMPQMNGSDLYRRLAAMRPGLRVLFMSGYLDDTVALHGVAGEGENFIQKPFTIRALTKKVREALDK